MKNSAAEFKPKVQRGIHSYNANQKLPLKLRTMGVIVLLFIIYSFFMGSIRGELVLTLTGAVFLAIWIYCLIMTLLLALLHRRRAGRVSISLSPEKLVCGESTQVIFSENNEMAHNSRFFQLPGILVRCRILLYTNDGRLIKHDFKPESKKGFSKGESFLVEKRGAYFSVYDEFAVFDILGFFRFIFRIHVETSNLTAISQPEFKTVKEYDPFFNNNPRILAGPHPALEPVPLRLKSGEYDRHDNQAYERTDNLIDHRPYVPGDDPRRINWKLYSHGGELFIRQGEREPPPHSNIIILIDTQYETKNKGIPALYNNKSAQDAVDLLCENALAAAVSGGKEINVQIGFTGQSEISNSSLIPAELGFFLAHPAALPVILTAELPLPPDDRGILLLAMPRISTEVSALDVFLTKNATRSIELIFIYNAKAPNDRLQMIRQAAETCVALYNKRPGIRAHALEVLPAPYSGEQ
jgi:hypothetical protein